jgi:hypothetical protein
VNHPLGSPFKDGLMALTTNIRLGLKKPARSKHLILLGPLINYKNSRVVNTFPPE